MSHAVEALGVLASVVLGLRTVGLEATWAAGVDLPRVAEPFDIGASMRWIRRGSRWIPGARRCLPRALAGAILLRRHGRHGELVVGVRARPFGAHAWLVHEGSVLLGAGAEPGHEPIWRVSF